MKTTADLIATITQLRDSVDKFQSDNLNAFNEETCEALSDAYQALETALCVFQRQTDSPVEDSYPSYEDQHRLTARDLGVVA